MGAPFATPEDVSRRLHHTVCLWKGEPVSVTYRHPNVTITHLNPKTYGHAEVVDYTSDDFDYKTMPLGYMNYNVGAYYLTRMPERRSNQGLNERCVDIVSHSQNFIGGEIIFTEAMYDCVMGKYPKLEKAIKDISGPRPARESVAISRHVAIGRMRDRDRTFALYYRGRLVAHAPMSKTPEFTLFGERAYSIIIKEIQSLGVVIR